MLDELGIGYEKKLSLLTERQRICLTMPKAPKERLEGDYCRAGGAAHLPGMTASKTTLPVIGVPVESKALKGMDSLLSIVQMPGGVPTATMAIGKAGAVNAGLFAAQILAVNQTDISVKLDNYRKQLQMKVKEMRDELAEK